MRAITTIPAEIASRLALKSAVVLAALARALVLGAQTPQVLDALGAIHSYSWQRRISFVLADGSAFTCLGQQGNRAAWVPDRHS